MQQIPTHVVLRKFEGTGVRYRPDQVVDARKFRNTNPLVSQRYLAPLPAGAVVAQDPEGHWWYCRTGAVPEGMRRVGETTHHTDPIGSGPFKPEPGPSDVDTSGSTTYPRHLGFGRWELSDGTTMKASKDEVLAAEEALRMEVAQ